MLKAFARRMGAILLIFLYGCAASTPNNQPNSEKDAEILYPPFCEAVQEVAGQKIEVVVAHLGLQAEDFHYNGQTYQYSESIPYLGQTFQMHLCSYGNEENGHIKGVEYIIELDKTEDVIAEILDLRKRIESAYGPADEIAGPRQIEEAQLVEAFETDEYWGSKMVWILSRDIPEEAREQFASTCWALHFSVMMPNELGDSETKGKVYIQLSFSLTMEPQGNVGG